MKVAPRIRVTKVRFSRSMAETRLPFKFGMTVMENALLLSARVSVEDESGRRATGYAADTIVPKWFEKDPPKSAEEDRLALVDSAQAAGILSLDDDAPQSVFRRWKTLYEERVQSVPPLASDRMVRGFGVAMIERAMIDACCTLVQLPFHDALRSGALGFEAAAVLPELAGALIQDFLPERPAKSIALRHTVGGRDPLEDADIPEEERVDDGLPQSLEACTKQLGLTHFKIKICGDPDADLERLHRVAAVLDRVVPGGARFSLDGNEQYENLEDLLLLFERVMLDDGLRHFFGHCLFVEQPLPRDKSLDVDATELMSRVSTLAPCILDEADSDVRSFARAIELGYRGCSIKNCKGVFRGIANGMLAARSELPLFLSAEDLTTVPVVSLQQDLTTIASLGLPSVERNGHHYFRGMQHLAQGLEKAAVLSHPDLYDAIPRHGDAPATHTLSVKEGQIRLASLHVPGFGHSLHEALTAEHWAAESEDIEL